MQGLGFGPSGKRIWVAGQLGIVSYTVARFFASDNCIVYTAARSEVDPTRETEFERFVASSKPGVIVPATANVGVNPANDNFPADFLNEAPPLEDAVFGAANGNCVESLLVPGSSCIDSDAFARPKSRRSSATRSRTRLGFRDCPTRHVPGTGRSRPQGGASSFIAEVARTRSDREL